MTQLDSESEHMQEVVLSLEYQLAAMRSGRGSLGGSLTGPDSTVLAGYNLECRLVGDLRKEMSVMEADFSVELMKKAECLSTAADDVQIAHEAAMQAGRERDAN